MEPRTSGAIALRPSRNKQEGHYFLSLHTGKRILRNHWTVLLPMPNDVVDAVHRLAAASKQAGGITFTDKDGNIITDDDDEEIEEAMENDKPIAVPGDHHKDIINNDREETDKEAIPGVDEQNTVDAHDITPSALDNQDKAITVMDNEQSTESTHDNTQPIPEEENDPDEYVTIGDTNIMSEKNASNRGAEMEQMENQGTNIRTNERYNL